MAFDFDLFVIGGGSGGVAAARRAGSYGVKVGLAEGSRLGGTCVNRGCVPKKLMVFASRFPDQLVEAEGYGWTSVNRHLNWSTLIGGIHQQVARLNDVYQDMLEKVSVQIFPDYAHFIDSHTLAIKDQTITAQTILIAVGGHPIKPETISGIEHAITSDDIFHLPDQPQRVVIIGGGYIGCEFACILHGLGTEVTQIIRDDKILRGFDDDIRTEIQSAMERHGIRIISQTQAIEIHSTETRLSTSIKGRSGKETLITDVVALAATGRRPNLDRLNLASTQVEVCNGAIVVNGSSQTHDPNIYAVGDCTDRITLTPVAIHEGRAFAESRFGADSHSINYENIPTAIFTTPEAATVGLSEAEAKHLYGESLIKVYRTHFQPMYYTLAGRDEKALIKVIVHQETDRVLGAHIVGPAASEIIQGIAIAVKMGATKSNFDATIGIHPTIAEEFVTLR